MKNDDIKTSKKFIKATNTAFYTAMTGWVTGQCSTPQQVATAAALAFGGYYFNNTDVENIYFFKSHHYRILGPHWFDGNGIAYGNYELKRNVRTTKSTNGVGGQLTTKTQKTTSIWSLW